MRRKRERKEQRRQVVDDIKGIESFRAIFRASLLFHSHGRGIWTVESCGFGLGAKLSFGIGYNEVDSRVEGGGGGRRGYEARGAEQRRSRYRVLALPSTEKTQQRISIVLILQLRAG